jgi:hypothetical protein
MKLSEFTRRARASRLEKKAKFDAAFTRALRDLKLAEPGTRVDETISRAGTQGDSRRPVLTLFPRHATDGLSSRK